MRMTSGAPSVAKRTTRPTIGSQPDRDVATGRAIDKATIKGVLSL